MPFTVYPINYKNYDVIVNDVFNGINYNVMLLIT